MQIVDPREFFPKDMFREKDFRAAVKSHDWSKYRDLPVLIQGCSAAIPTWAYLVFAAELFPFAKSISYGELSSPIPVSGKLGAAAV